MKETHSASYQQLELFADFQQYKLYITRNCSLTQGFCTSAWKEPTVNRGYY